MTPRSSTALLTTCLAAALLATAAPAPPVRAQYLLDWFSSDSGENSVADRKVVTFSPVYTPGQIVVSFGDRRLYHVTERGKAVSYPIGVPRAESRWQGTLVVSQKRVNPSWTPTEEMRRDNPKLPASVPGGHPLNPLGVRALYLGSTLYRIHGTDAPWTIGQNVSRGCVRMHNEHVVELYDRVQAGAKVTATWKRFATAAVETKPAGVLTDWVPW